MLYEGPFPLALPSQPPTRYPFATICDLCSLYQLEWYVVLLDNPVDGRTISMLQWNGTDIDPTVDGEIVNSANLFRSDPIQLFIAVIEYSRL